MGGCGRGVEFGRFCHGDPRNFVSWPAEFGKIFRGKQTVGPSDHQIKSDWW